MDDKDKSLTTKEREQRQLKLDIEQFLLNGGQIEVLPPTTVKRLNTANVKKSTQ